MPSSAASDCGFGASARTVVIDASLARMSRALSLETSARRQGVRAVRARASTVVPRDVAERRSLDQILEVLVGAQLRARNTAYPQRPFGTVSRLTAPRA